MLDRSQGAKEGMRIVIGKDDEEDGSENSPKLVVRPYTSELHSSTGRRFIDTDSCCNDVRSSHGWGTEEAGWCNEEEMDRCLRGIERKQSYLLSL